MLLELVITDFAIIDHVRLHFSPAFNVLTGETGAGKSIMIDALGMLRGERADPTFVRAGSAGARVEGIFSLAQRPDVQPLLESYGLHEAGDDEVIIMREINAASGRSTARINGRAVNSAILREIGGRLVDIHGQHEGLALFNVKTHGDMLDRFAGLVPEREAVGRLVDQLLEIRQRINDLRSAESRRQERIEELEFLIQDLEAAKLTPGEEERLTHERSLLQNGARITQSVEAAYRILKTGGVSSERRPAVSAVVDLLEDAVGHISDLARFDVSLAGLNEQALEVRYRLDDVIAGLRDYREQLDFEPGRLELIEDRLAELRELCRRHRAQSPDDLIDMLAAASDELDTLMHSAEHIQELQQQEHALQARLGTTAAALSAKRREAGDALAQKLQAVVRDLAMPHVRLYVSLSQRQDPGGIEAPGHAGRLGFDRTGIDSVEFLLSPNPGEPLKPLARIASGGESARILLAMKSILSAVDATPTLVFDEVDVGVGGRSGHVVGEKLWGLTGDHQVLCITHLPQVAAFGDLHFAIAKHVEGERTKTSVRELSPEERTNELAAMLDGLPISEASRRSAAEMLERAAAYKAARSDSVATH